MTTTVKPPLPGDHTLLYLKRFAWAVVALASHSWTLSCLLEKAPLGHLRSRDMLDRVCTRLRFMSSLFLAVRSRLIQNRPDVKSLEDVEDWQQYVDTSTDLESLFIYFKPVNAVCFSLSDYSRCSGTTDQNKAFLVSIMPEFEETFVVLSDDAVCEALMMAVLSCEIRILEILSRFETLSDILLNLRASIDDTYVP